MFLRGLTTWLLVAVLLGCPYVCILQLALPMSMSDSLCSCGSCHGLDHSEFLEPPPSDSGSSEGQTPCLCKGAVLECSEKLIDIGREAARSSFFEDALLALSRRPASSAINDGRCFLAHASHFPPLSSGRDICALVNSRLL